MEVSSESTVVRGLSLAVIVLSVIGIIVCIGGLVCGTMASFYIVDVAAENGDFADAIQIDAQVNSLIGSGVQHLSSADAVASGTTIQSRAVALTVFLILVWGFIGIGLFGYIAALVAGVLGLHNSAKPGKLTGAFAWTIIAAVLAMVTLRVVSLILLVVLAVYIYKVRQQQPAA